MLDFKKFTIKMLVFIFCIISCFSMAIASASEKLTSKDRIFKSVDMSLNHMCWVDQEGLLDCMGANDELQSSVSVGVGNVKSAAAGGDKKNFCIIDDNHEIICWGEDSVGYAVKGLDKPKQIFMDLFDNSGFSCALQEDKKVKCWKSHAEFVKYNSLEATFIDSLVVENVKTMAINVEKACAVTYADKIICWDEDGFVKVDQTKADGSFKGIHEVSFGRYHICISDEKNTSCAKLTKFGDDDAIKFSTIHNDTVPLSNIVFKKTFRDDIYIVCGSHKASVKCYDISDNSASNNAVLIAELKTEKSVMRFNFNFRDNPVRDGYSLCAYTKQKKTICNKLNEEHKNLGSFQENDKYFFKEVYSIKDTFIGNNCFLNSKGKIYCYDLYSLKKDKGEIKHPKENNISVDAVYTERDFTCTLNAGEVKCWGYVFFRDDIFGKEKRLKEKSISDVKLKLLAQFTSDDFIINGTTNSCVIHNLSVRCKYRGSKNEAIEYDMLFADPPFFIKQFDIGYISHHSTSIVCGVSNTETKCWNVGRNNKKAHLMPGEKEKPYLLISGLKYGCYKSSSELKCTSPFYDYSTWFEVGGRDELNYEFVVSLDKSVKNYDFYEYDYSVNKVCAYKFNSSESKCWQPERYRAITALENYSFYVYDPTYICGIYSSNYKNTAMCVDRHHNQNGSNVKFNVKNPWFISSYENDGKNMNLKKVGQNVCINGDGGLWCGTNYINKVINHINVSVDYLKTSMHGHMRQFSDSLFEAENNTPLLYSRLIKTLRSSAQEQYTANNILLLVDDFNSEYKSKSLLASYLVDKSIFIFENIDSDIVQKRILPIFYEMQDSISSEGPEGNSLSKSTKLSLLKLQLKIHLDTLKFLLELAPSKAHFFNEYVNTLDRTVAAKPNMLIYKKKINSLTKKYKKIEKALDEIVLVNDELTLIVELISVTKSDVETLLSLNER